MTKKIILRNKWSGMFYIMMIASFSCSAQSEPKSNSNGFIPDTTINNMIAFRTNARTEKFKWSGVKLYQEITMRVAFFSNNKSTQYLKVKQYPGDVNYQFSWFEVGPLEAHHPDKKKLVKLPWDYFQTESGIHLGMTKEELIQTKGKNYISKVVNDVEVLFYNFDNFDTSSFLKRYNMPAYAAEYGIKNGVLVRFFFGFPDP